MTKELFLDIETYSPVPIKLGVYAYVNHPDFKILMTSWAFDDDPVVVTVGDHSALPIRVRMAINDPSITKVAHNAQFERICFSAVWGRGVDYLDPEQWHDTAAVAANRGYPRNLGKLARALGGEQKDEAGTRLINLFCVPQRKFNYARAYLPEEKPDEWLEFIGYGHQDTVTHRDVHRKLGGWPTERERQVFLADQRLNDRGLLIDQDLAEEAEEAAAQNTQAAAEETIQITGVTTANSIPQIKAWLAAMGCRLDDMKAETIEAKLEESGLEPKARRVLYLRQVLALTAVKKFRVALDSVATDGRVRGQFLYHGAHTGRWSGRGIQLHNLPRHQFKTDTETNAAIVDLHLGLGASTDDLKRLVRPMLVIGGSVVDYASIEARVLAWLADEEWALKAFREGRDIYVETADRMSTPGNKLNRSQGKVAVLALGFNGGINSLKVMGANGTDSALQFLVNAWRGTNQNIVGMWGEMEDAFRRGGYVGAHVEVLKDGDDRLIRLPSGRSIEYHGFKMRWVDTAWGRKAAASFIDPNKGIRVGTYGGRLTENITQAVARDVLADALVRLDHGGFRPVGHIHDEVLCESTDLEGVIKTMTKVPEWATGLPIDAEGFTTERYKKG